MNRETLLAAIKTKPLPIHSCSICGYQCSFYFVDEQFGYDSGCDCSRYPLMWTPRDVDELDFYLNEASWAETLREFVSTATPPAPSGRCKREIFDPPCDCCPPYGPLKDDQPSAPIGFNEFGNPNDPSDFYPSASDERDAEEYTDAVMVPCAKPYASSNGHYARGLKSGFLAGRRGMVPRFAQDDNYKRGYAEAIKAEQKRIVKLIADKRSWYAEDIFSPLTAGERDPVSRDRVSAHMARHICTLIVNDILNPSEEGKE